MHRPPLPILLLVMGLVALSGCDTASERQAAHPRQDDPSISAALGDPIMSDPDLSGQDMGMVGVILPESDVQGEPVLPTEAVK